MAEYDNVRTGRRGIFILHAHVVFLTKYRYKVFADRHQARPEIMRGGVRHFECGLVEFNGEANHAHLLVDLPLKVAL
jgi:putative transposase